ncbi:hypothetical protein C8J57DRAFT_1255770 [Mycena rebaudengoi]|nr:hypothetical protein C8J57DRAFT_1255770 [Mycena rebaudengoi]
MTNMQSLHSISSITLDDTHLAVIGQDDAKLTYIHSMRILLKPEISISVEGVFRAQTLDNLSASSFAIMDSDHFLVAGPCGMTVYSLSRALKRFDHSGAGDVIRRVRPFWTHHYDAQDGGSTARVRVSTRHLVDRVPVQISMVAGFNIGIYRRSYSMPLFTTFWMRETVSEFHPFSYKSDHVVAEKGSVAFRPALHDVLEYNTLQIDEAVAYLERCVFDLRLASLLEIASEKPEQRERETTGRVSRLRPVGQLPTDIVDKMRGVQSTSVVVSPAAGATQSIFGPAPSTQRTLDTRFTKSDEAGRVLTMLLLGDPVGEQRSWSQWGHCVACFCQGHGHCGLVA